MLEECRSVLPLTQEELKLVNSLVRIVTSKWCLSAKFMVRSRSVIYDCYGNEKEVSYHIVPRYIPLDRCSTLKEGDLIRAEDLWIIDFGNNKIRVLEDA